MGATAKAVDFSGVKDRGNFNTRRVPEGDYAAKIVKVEDGESSKDQTFQYVFTIKLKKYSQNAYPYYCKLTDNQLWKLRNLLVAAGLNVPKKRVKLDPNKVVGKDIGVTMTDDEYDGKPKSVIDAVFPIAELAEGGVEPEDEEFEGDEVDDEEEDVDTEEETEDEDEDEDEDEEEDEEPTPPPAKKKAKKKPAPAEDDEDLDELDISDL